MGSESSSGSAGPSPMSARRSSSSAGISRAVATPRVTSTDSWRAVKAVSSGRATCSATVLVATTLSSSGAPWARRMASVASAARFTICEAMGSRRWPPAVSSIVPAERSTSGSPRWLRSAASAPDTAGSVTPSARAAALTDPSRATSTNASSCVSVTDTNVAPRSSGRLAASAYAWRLA